MGLLDLLFGSSGDDATDGDGFLSPLFGSGQSNRFQPSAGFFWRPQTALPAPASPSAQSGIQAVPTYYSRIGENQGFAVGPAYEAAKESQLPGRENGPADAFRHMVWAAELTRRYGAATASDILDEHKKSGRHGEGWTQDAENMDRHNNTLGIRIGTTAKDYDEVLMRVQRMIESAAPDGSGGWRDPNNHAPISAPIWLPSNQWRGSSGPEINWYDNPAHPGSLVFPGIWQHLYQLGGAEENYDGSISSDIGGWLGAREQQYVEPLRQWWRRNMPHL
jgi:hypothetical protein